MNNYPKIKSVKILKKKRIEISFENGTKKVYDCKPLLKEDTFKTLRDNALFKQVHVDDNGYGIIWNNQIDLSESELWINGIKK